MQVLASVLRGQFNGMMDITYAILTLTAAQVDGVTALGPGLPATASVSVTGNTMHFTFGIPQGQTGQAGSDGSQEPPFAQAIIDAVTTVQADSAATGQNGEVTQWSWTTPLLIPTWRLCARR